MAINYTSSIPRVVMDNGAPLDQAPNFQHVYDWDTWNRYENPNEPMFQYYRPGDLNYYRQDEGPKDLNYWKQKVGGPQGDTQSADTANSSASSEPQDFKSRMRAIIHDPNSKWEQSAARGRAMMAADDGKSIDGGSLNPEQIIRRNKAIGSPEWVQAKLPSGTPNGPLNYDATGKTITDDGKNALREKGWTEEQINSLTDGTMQGNWGADQYFNRNNMQEDTQAKYEAYLNAMMRANQANQANSYSGGESAQSTTPSLVGSNSSGAYDPALSAAREYADENGDYDPYDPYGSTLPDYGRRTPPTNTPNTSTTSNGDVYVRGRPNHQALDMNPWSALVKYNQNGGHW